MLLAVIYRVLWANVASGFVQPVELLSWIFAALDEPRLGVVQSGVVDALGSDVQKELKHTFGGDDADLLVLFFAEEGLDISDAVAIRFGSPLATAVA